ncbi:FtsX-like permease family protein [Candidatus Peregrinibacteria bacterium]|nr:FtsX-like permease family protein [Candidatus Peregrinibacteria bacterium]
MQLFRHFDKSGFGQRTIWFRRVAKNGWNNLMRNKVLTIATTLIIALMFFVFNLVLALTYASDSVLQSLGKKVDIRVETLSSAESYSIQTLVNRLKELPEVDQVIFISKEEALKNFGDKYPNVISFLDRNNLKNPLPNVLRVVGTDVSANGAIVQFLELPEFAQVVNQDKLKNDLDQKSRNEKILNITQFIKEVGFWLNLVFALVSLLIIFNSININIHTHRFEINIMRLVGAKTNFIRGGFLFEGMLYALLAFALSLVFSEITLLYLSKNLISVISNENLLIGLDSILLHFEDQFWFTFLWQFFGVMSVGVMSSFMATELYFRKRFSF